MHTAFFHHAARSGIVDIVAGFQTVKMQFIERIADQTRECFRHDPLVPVRGIKAVTDLGAAMFRRKAYVSDRADHPVIIPVLNGENAGQPVPVLSAAQADKAPGFPDTLMGRPENVSADRFVPGKREQIPGVFEMDGPEDQSFCIQNGWV